MKTEQAAPGTVDDYIAGFEEEVREKLEEVRATIRQAAPDAVETISYGIPTFKLNGKSLVHFAAFNTHIGLYPTPSGMAAFEAALSPYASGKGTAKFGLDGPIPFDLIGDIVKFRAEEISTRPERRGSKPS